VEDNDQDQMMNSYFDRHEMMMVAMLDEEEKVVVVVIVALNTDLRMLDNMLDQYT
jgi:hypothetical protein